MVDPGFSFEACLSRFKGKWMCLRRHSSVFKINLYLDFVKLDLSEMTANGKADNNPRFSEKLLLKLNCQYINV